MDSETLKAIAEEVGGYVRDKVSDIESRLSDLQADVEAIPEARDGADGADGQRGEKGDSIQGERGPQGDTGPAGPPGPMGPAGESVKGEKGERGEAGESIVGPEGPPGPVGPAGESIQGEKGDTGPQGPQGDDGVGIDVPLWSEGVYREGAEVQHHFGQFFRAIKDTAQNPDSADWERIGSSGFRLTGSFSKGAEYRDGDLFVKDFGLFLHKSGDAVCIAGRGPKGERGKAGRDGVGKDGQDGSDGKDGSTIELLELRGANLVAVTKNADGEVKDHAVSLEPFLQTAALVTKEAQSQSNKELIAEADSYVRKLFDELNNHLDDDQATPINFYRGLWKSETRYQVGDWVRFGTEGFLCKRTNTGVFPKNYPNQQQTASDYWQSVSGLPTHGAGVDGDNSGGGGGIITADQLTKEGAQGGTKFSQFASVSGEGITGVGIANGQNVKFALTTDAVSVNPNPFRNAKNGQFIGTPEELASLKNQRDVNEFLYNAISDIEAGDIDLEGYATEEQLAQVNEASEFRDDALNQKIDDESQKNTVAHVKLEDQIQWTNTHWQQGDAKLQNQIDNLKDGASQEEKIALIEAQIQYRGLLTLDADDKPVWPADQTKDRGGWWAYPSSKLSSLWKHDKLEWIFPYAGEDFDVTKKAAPEYKVGDIIQLQISNNEAGAGTSWQYLDTAPVFVEYMVEEVYYPNTQAGNENRYNPAYRVSMSGPAHRYTGSLPNVVKGPQGDPSDAWIQWYPTTFAFGATASDGGELISKAESKADDQLLQGEIEQVALALEALLTARTAGQWVFDGTVEGGPPRTPGTFKALADMSATENYLALHMEDANGITHAFGDAEIGDYIEVVDMDDPKVYALYVLTAEPPISGDLVELPVKLKDRGADFEIGDSCTIRHFAVNQEDINLSELDDRYLKLAGGEMTGQLTIKKNNEVALDIVGDGNQSQIKFWSSGAIALQRYTAFKDNELVTKKYVDDAVIEAQSGGGQSALPEWELAHFTFDELQAGKMAFCDGNLKGTNNLENARGIVFSATDANGNRHGRTKDGVDWERDFGGVLNVLYDEEKTILTMARSHGSASSIIYYVAEVDAYMIIWPQDKDAAVTSNITHVVLDQKYQIHCPEIFF